MKFSIKDFFSKCNQIRSFLRIWSYLPKKSLMENFIFCAVKHASVIACLGPVFTWKKEPYIPIFCFKKIKELNEKEFLLYIKIDSKCLRLNI